jgi:putative membrane protein
MSGDLFDKALKERATKAIAAIEAQTDADVVIAVRGQSSDYAEADLVVAFAASMITLVAMMHVETEFPIAVFSVACVLVFVIAAMISARLPIARRLFVRAARKEAAVDAMAKVAFHDLGVARTRHRLGVLVYVSVFEREARVIADIGALAHADPEAWGKIEKLLDGAAKAPHDGDRFLAALKELGDLLAHALPATGMEHELADAPDVRVK